jgi:hypothetical protein
MRDEHYSPFKGRPPEPTRLEAVTVFVMARVRDGQTDSMRGSVRPGPHGCEAVYTLNGELYRAQWFASEALARADLATHQDALSAGGRCSVPARARDDVRRALPAMLRLRSNGLPLGEVHKVSGSGLQAATISTPASHITRRPKEPGRATSRPPRSPSKKKLPKNKRPRLAQLLQGDCWVASRISAEPTTRSPMLS